LRGLKIYREGCAGCHGDFAGASRWGTRGFYPRVPQFVDVEVPLTAAEMFVTIKHGVRYTGMGAWDKMLTDDEIWDVIAFVKQIRSLPAPADQVWKSPKPTS